MSAASTTAMAGAANEYRRLLPFRSARCAGRKSWLFRVEQAAARERPAFSAPPTAAARFPGGACASSPADAIAAEFSPARPRGPAALAVAAELARPERAAVRSLQPRA